MKQIQLRNGAEVWVTDEEAMQLIGLVNNGDSKLIVIGENAINPKDIVGIFSEEVAIEREQKRRGLWRGDNGKWLTKSEDLFRKPFVPKDDTKLIE
jgi:hypothetical protein